MSAASDVAAAWTAHYATDAGYRRWPSEELVRFIAGRHLGTVVEAGCGTGANLWLLAEHADRVIGVDVSAVALRAADELLQTRGVRDRVVLRRADVRALPVASGSIDLVVDCLTAQHVPWADHAALWAGYRRVLREGGQLWVMHLDDRTHSARGQRLAEYDYAGLALFPTVEYFCLPPESMLLAQLRGQWSSLTVRRLVRGYPDGQTASYTILEALREA